MKHLLWSHLASRTSGTGYRCLSIIFVLIAIVAIHGTALASFSNETASTDGTNLIYKVSYTGTYAHFHVFYDTDNNASTGYTITGIGADYLIEDTSFYKYSGSGGAWGWTSQSTTVTKTTPVSGTVQYSIPLSAIGSPAVVKIAFQGEDANYNATNDPTVVTYTSKSYYVSPSGVDTNPGTINAPWKTGQKAANTVNAGATVYFRAGTYAPFTVNVSGSSSGGYITFQNYPSEAAIIDGTGWTANYDQGMIDVPSQSYIKIQGFEIRNASTTSTTSGPAGIFVHGQGSYIQILNNHIHNISNTNVNGDAHGIFVLGDGASADIDNVTISGNELNALQTAYSECCTLNGNVTTFTVSSNKIHDNNNIGLVVAGFYGHSSLNDQARNGTVSGNTIYNCSTINNPTYGYYSCAGLYVDGGTNVVLERNTVYNCDIGIATSSEKAGHVTSYVTSRSNLIYKNEVAGIQIGGYNASVGGTDHCTYVNNTLYANNVLQYADGEVDVFYKATNNVFENNIVYASPSVYFVYDQANDGSNIGTFDYNDYYSTSGASAANWRWKGVVYPSFTSWKGTGQDAHSLFADPLFVSTSTPNLDTGSASPARNAGSNLGSSVVGTLDFAGNARIAGTAIDIGAYEH